jgi:hypothetical protein
MEEKKLRKLYESRKYSRDRINFAVESVKQLEKYLAESDGDLSSVHLKDVKGYVKGLIDTGGNSADCILALARYFYITDKQDVYLYFTSVLGVVGVISSIKSRVSAFEGEETAETVFSGMEEPSLGSDIAEYPRFTAGLMQGLRKCMSPGRYRKALAGNNHGIPIEAMLEEKKIFEQSASLDAYLLDLQNRKVAVLQKHADEKTIWYEQVITQEVVDYVRGNPELLSGIRVDDKIFTTKIPHNPVKFLEETDPLMRGYYTCHCPFAKEAILKDDIEISMDWCYCSAGFEKYLFDVIFDTDLDVEVLESVLGGDPQCRFAITIPPGKS